PETAQTALRALLPTGQDALEQLLQQMAAEEGLELEIETAAAGNRYADAVNEALGGENAPDIFYLKGDAEVKRVDAGQMADLLDDAASAPMRALAALVPQPARIVDSQRVYGLPLGQQAAGYLVNVELLAPLVGAQDTSALLADLQACTWQQWQALAEAIEAYLPAPSRRQVTIGHHSYTMPGSRPGIAQPLRGVFAVPDGDAEKLMQGGLEAAIHLAFDDYSTLLAANDTEKAQRLWAAAEGLLGMLALETQHMARESGPLARGERYRTTERNSNTKAIELFVGRTALFMRGDSALAGALQAQYPELTGKLALIPYKMPDPQVDEEETEAPVSAPTSEAGEAESDETAASEVETESETSASEPVASEAQAVGEETDEPQASALADWQKAIRAQNTQLLCADGGTLCIRAGSANAGAAQNLLLRLFTTGAGRMAIEKTLHLQPFSTVVPTGLWQAQVAQAMADGQALATPWPAETTGAKQAIGAEVQRLTELAEWGQEEREAFQGALLKGLGIYVDLQSPAETDEDGEG
ncbi:MAG: hypothetical protein AB7V55_03900, partial [Oscillospiraceae bacterium]